MEWLDSVYNILTSKTLWIYAKDIVEELKDSSEIEDHLKNDANMVAFLNKRPEGIKESTK